MQAFRFAGYELLTVRVGSTNTFEVRQVVYSVPPTLIGRQVTVRLHRGAPLFRVNQLDGHVSDRRRIPEEACIGGWVFDRLVMSDQVVHTHDGAPRPLKEYTVLIDNFLPSMPKAAIFVPVKGSSERIPSKNLQLLDGKPLFLHTLEKLSFLEDVDLYLDTESSEVVKLASHLNGVQVMNRDPRLANNKTDGNCLFLNEVAHCSHDVVVQHLCTSPFIELDTIKKAISVVGGLQGSSQYDSALLVRREKQYLWRDEQPIYDMNNIPNSVDLDDSVIETMGLYAVTREAALCTLRRIGNKPYLLCASPLEAVDVNWPEDFDLAQLIAAGKRENEQRLYANLASVMTSALLSDLLDDLGYTNQIIRGLKRTSGSANAFGPAKTLKLREIQSNEDFKGIYRALDHYLTLVPGDVICVENEVSSYAYFGGLNANLAIRQGVRAVVVGGMTRDSSEVNRIGLPVYAEGITCQDVRGRAVLESMNKAIQIKGIAIVPGDLIFSDDEGVVVIPRRLQNIVIEQMTAKFKNENSIVTDIAMGLATDELVKTRGEF